MSLHSIDWRGGTSTTTLQGYDARPKCLWLVWPEITSFVPFYVRLLQTRLLNIHKCIYYHVPPDNMLNTTRVCAYRIKNLVQLFYAC